MAKKGKKLTKLVKTAKTPKGFAIISTAVLAVAVGAYAVASYAATSVTPSKPWSKTYSVSVNGTYKFCMKTNYNGKVKGALTAMGQSAAINVNGKGSASFCTTGKVTNQSIKASIKLSEGTLSLVGPTIKKQ